MTREVMQQALEALEAVGAEFICDATHHHTKEQHGGLDDCPNQARHDRAITAIREALAQPPQPVQPSVTRPCRSCDGTGDRDTGIPESPIATCKPCKGTGQIAIAPLPPLPVQEPVAVAYLCENGVGHRYFRWKKPSDIYKPIALYTAPPAPPATQRPWVGLTDEEIESTATSVNIEFDDDFSLSDQTIYYVNADSFIGFTRAIEAKLKELNK